jgi:hypothetical protein
MQPAETIPVASGRPAAIPLRAEESDFSKSGLDATMADRCIQARYRPGN